MEQFQLIFELIGTVAFAISGAMLGIRKGLDLFGVSMTGMLTTVGGGILRDTILGRTPRRTEPPALQRICLRHGNGAVLSAEQVL